MKKIDNTILTRKAFRDLVKLFENNKKSIIVQKGSYDRWKHYSFILQFIDGCVLPSRENGTVLCFTTDTSKALKKKPGIDIDVKYVAFPRSIETVQEVSSFLKNELSKTKSDVVYFESMPFVNDSEMHLSTLMKLVQSLDNCLRPIIYKKQDTGTLSSRVDQHVCLDTTDIIVDVRGCIVDVLKSPNGLVDYTFFYNCQKDIKTFQ